MLGRHVFVKLHEPTSLSGLRVFDPVRQYAVSPGGYRCSLLSGHHQPYTFSSDTGTLIHGQKAKEIANDTDDKIGRELYCKTS
jgi:hypothetical protein